MIRPIKSELEEYHVDYPRDTDFSSYARLLQSKWRESKKLQFAKYGNFLDIEIAKSTKANFLTKNIQDLVSEQIKKVRIEGGLIGEPRIWNNLLSSQPLCFNLFGELCFDLDLASQYFKTLFPNRIEVATGIKFEYSPSRKNEKYTGDSSAFDVFIEYSNAGKKGFLGIEVKYVESLKEESNAQATKNWEKHKKRYTELTIEKSIFIADSIPKLKLPPLSQIWRDHLLAISLQKDYDEGFFVFLYPSQNKECQTGVDNYKKYLASNNEMQNYFCPRHLEEFINVLLKLTDMDWVKELKMRYLPN